MKTQVRVCKRTRRILDTAFAKGARHDFSLYKASKVRLPKKTECLADSGYQGIRELHKKSRTPLKKPKGGELTVPQKAANKQLARERVLVENVIRHLKIFRILSGAISESAATFDAAR